MSKHSRNMENRAKKIINTVVGGHHNKNDFLEGEIEMDNETYIVARSNSTMIDLPYKDILYRYIPFNNEYYDIYTVKQK